MRIRLPSAQDDTFTWTIDEAPFRARAGGAAEPLCADPPPAPIPAKPPAEPARALWLPVSAVAGVLLTIWLSTLWAAWQRETAIRETVAREERAALAGDLAGLRALSDPADSAWLDERLHYAAAGLPAPLPLRSLAPAPIPGWVRSLTVVSPDVIRVDVARAFRAPDWTRPAFALPQFYRRVNGAWRRTPPPVAFWGRPQRLEGRFVTLRFRPVDEALAQEWLPELEALLERVCADLGCPPAPITVSLEPEVALPPQTSNQRAGDPFLIAGLPPVINRYPEYRLRAPSPHGVGYPLDDTGRRLLQRTLATHVLFAAADRAAFADGDGEDDGNAFFYALVVRLAARYGLEAPAVFTYRAPPAEEPVNLDRLWRLRFSVWRHPDLIRHALAQLNDWLAEAPPQSEAALLLHLREAPSLEAWLAAGTGYNRLIPLEESPTAWQSMAAFSPAPGPPAASTWATTWAPSKTMSPCRTTMSASTASSTCTR